ncbi:MAG: hypothetical protein ACNA8W_26530 [Bradymonadaceae bacterium]
MKIHTNVKNFIVIVGLVGLMAPALTGCAAFAIDTPPEMVEVPKRVDRDYDYRAMTPHGVVVGVRTIRQGTRGSMPAATHAFWLEGMRERMRTMGGYALLEEEDIVSSNGHAGTLLKFGRDLPGGSYYYWVTLYVTDEYVHVVDAAGERERFDGAEGVVKKALASYKVRR